MLLTLFEITTGEGTASALPSGLESAGLLVFGAVLVAAAVLLRSRFGTRRPETAEEKVNRRA